jgi:hypothetical protein
MTIIRTSRGIWLHCWWMVQLSLYTPWRRTCEVDVELHVFFTSVLDGGEWSVSRPDLFTPPKFPWYPLNRGLGGPQNRWGRCAGYRTPHRPACNLVTIPTTLSRSPSSQQYEYKQVQPNRWLITRHARKDVRESADARVVLNTAVATTGVTPAETTGIWNVIVYSTSGHFPTLPWTSGVPRGGGFKPPLPKFRSFGKAEPNSQFRGKYIRNCLVFLFHHPN